MSLFTKSEPLPSPAKTGLPPTQWVAYVCKRCNTSLVRLETAEVE